MKVLTSYSQSSASTVTSIFRESDGSISQWRLSTEMDNGSCLNVLSLEVSCYIWWREDGE